MENQKSIHHIQARLSGDEHKLVKTAIALSGVTTMAFMREAVLKRAEQIVQIKGEEK